jgi:hypothetical protein
MASIYTVAAVCKRWHALTSDISHISPTALHRLRATMLTACPTCNTPIKGELVVPG